MWKSPSNLKISEWADKYRKLSPESSAEAGAWNTSRSPIKKKLWMYLMNLIFKEL